MSTTENVVLGRDINQYVEEDLHILINLGLYLVQEPDSEATVIEMYFRSWKDYSAEDLMKKQKQIIPVLCGIFLCKVRL